jgi:murein DD-endopeptidase MepM/ murein hydrolase activator NlpD
MFDPQRSPIHFHFYWPQGTKPVRGSVHWPRAMALAGVALAGIGLLFFTLGCAHTKPAATAQASPATVQPEKIVLDYNNGWYHPADGQHTLREIAVHYKKDPQLVAELNRAKPDSIPADKTLLYIPPYNNREKLRSVLTRVQTNPGLIPHTPWDMGTKLADPRMKTKFAVKTADPWIANKRQMPTIVEEARATEATAKPRTQAAGKAASIANKPYATGLVPRQHPSPEGKNAPWSATGPEAADGNSVQIASLSGEATLPQRTARAGVALINQISDQMTQTRQQLAERGTTAPQGESTATAGQGNGECAWPLQGTVVTKFSEGWRKACHGIEIAAPLGTAVHAARGGRVLMAQEFLAYGKLIVIDHGDGFATAYGYNRDMRVGAGDAVKAGQTISTVGSAPHYGPQGKLFFQVRRNGLPVDPLKFLK